ncbi:TPA: hypothetical protein ACVOYJ_003770 [Vibrio diabolicus]
MKYFIVIVFLAFLSGCATTPVSIGNAHQISNSELLTEKFSNETNKTASLVIKRDKGFMGSACASRIYINGIAFADLDTSEYAVANVPAGRHIISAQPNGICAGGLSEIEAVLVSGEQRTYRVGMGTNGDYFIVPTAF